MERAMIEVTMTRFRLSRSARASRMGAEMATPRVAVLTVRLATDLGRERRA